VPATVLNLKGLDTYFSCPGWVGTIAGGNFFPIVVFYSLGA
jgi:hypothetical protein